ncbi:hypothetical protein B0H14DRAFT_3474869 [Mycena olivaceomarginata]|nr:hypothetical protein B0H14DRAFT_3474869 [Mycena olivaceomarginata]
MAERSRSHLRPRPAVFLRFPTVAIFCGSEISVDDDQHRPGNPQMLPVQLPPIATGPSANARSNGCGSAVHGGVCLTRWGREQCWYSWTDDVAPTVVPLETRYFPPVVAEVLGLTIEDGGRNECGCVPSAALVVQCGDGNPLGTLQTFCTAHAPRGAPTLRRAVYLFRASAVSPPPQTETSTKQAEPSMGISRILQTPTPTSPLGSIPPSLSVPSSVVPHPILAPMWDARHIRAGDFSGGTPRPSDSVQPASSPEFARVHNSRLLANARQSLAQRRTPNPMQGNTVPIGSVDGPSRSDEQDQQIERSFLAAISTQRARDAGWRRSLDQLDDVARLIAELEPHRATTATRRRIFFDR